MNYWDRARELFWKLYNEDPKKPVKDMWIEVYEVLKKEFPNG